MENCCRSKRCPLVPMTTVRQFVDPHALRPDFQITFLGNVAIGLAFVSHFIYVEFAGKLTFCEYQIVHTTPFRS